MSAARPVALTGAATQQAYSGAGIYRGFTIRETAGAVATVRLWDGTSAAGTLLDTIELAANESAREWYADGGIDFRNGVFVEKVAGTFEGSVRIG